MTQSYQYSTEYFDSLDDTWTKVSYPIISNLLGQEFHRKTTGRVLDLGCGHGAYARMLRGFGEVVIGVDPSLEAIKRCREGGGYDELQMCLAEELPFPDGQFDFVFSTEVLEHIENLDRAVSEVGRVLNKNGVFLFTTTLYWGSIWTYWEVSKTERHGLFKRLLELGHYVYGYVNANAQQRFIRTWCFKSLGGHYHGFHVTQLRKLAGVAGFKVQRVSRFFAVDPIPLLDGGSFRHTIKKGFPRNLVLLPFAVLIRLANVGMEMVGKGANNAFVVCTKS